MRLLFRVAIVLVICLVAIALPTAPAQANGGYIRLSPDQGVPGDEITVYGYNFTADEDLDIYYYRNGNRVRVFEVEADDDGDFKETFIVPESYTGAHKVRAEVSSSIYAEENFTVKPGLTVSPEEGPVGTNVTVKGHGFAEDEEKIKLRYYLDGNYTTIAQNIVADGYGGWEKSFQIPLSTQGSHAIDAEGEDSSAGDVRDAAFEVTPGINILDGPSGSIVDEPSGSPGQNITLTGSGFVAGERDITILFDGEAVEREIRADSRGHWQESFEVPERPKGTYNVTAEGEFTDEEDISAVNFEIKPGLVLSPNQGHVGTSLTVTGGGFATNKDVEVMYGGGQAATGRTNSKGSFNVTFAVPESPHGKRPVTAEVGGQVEATSNFTMESNPPGIPDLISPPDENRVGFIGKVRPTFEWSEVSDESGVRYSLQIASSANVTTAGFVEPVLSKQGLVGTNYTLNATEALPYGTYYWIVQVIDGAENESGWTAARSVKAGLLPLWAFILAIVVIVAAIGTLVYFFVFRKRIHYY